MASDGVPGWHQGFLDGDQLIHLATGPRRNPPLETRAGDPCLGIPQNAPPGVGLLLREPDGITDGTSSAEGLILPFRAIVFLRF